MPNVLTHVIRKPSQVDLGTFYRIVGHNSAGIPVPPQVWQPQRILRSVHTAVACFEGPMFLKIGQIVVHYDRHQIPFFDLNLVAQTEEWHDLHLEERGSNAATIAWVMGDRSYPEIARHARNLNRPLGLWQRYSG